MRTMNIGKLNKRLTFKRFEDVLDSLGQTTKKLVDVACVWGSLYPVRSTEYYEIQKIQSKTTHKCYIRYREDIDTNCHIEFDGKKYSIESVVDVDLSHKMLEIMCVEHTNKEVVSNG